MLRSWKCSQRYKLACSSKCCFLTAQPAWRQPLPIDAAILGEMCVWFWFILEQAFLPHDSELNTVHQPWIVAWQVLWGWGELVGSVWFIGSTSQSQASGTFMRMLFATHNTLFKGPSRQVLFLSVCRRLPCVQYVCCINVQCSNWKWNPTSSFIPRICVLVARAVSNNLLNSS